MLSKNKYNIALFFLLIISSCTFRSSNHLIKHVKRDQIDKIVIAYEIHYAKPPAHRKVEYNQALGKYYSNHAFKIRADSFANDYMPLLDVLKKVQYFNEEPQKVLERENRNEQDSIYCSFVSITFYRPKDYFDLTPIDESVTFDTNGSYMGLPNGSDKLWTYADDIYFDDDALQIKIIEFINKVIKYKNSTLVGSTDSLSTSFPLLPPFKQ